MTNVYTEWVNVVHFCNSWSIWFSPARGGGAPPLDPLPPSPGPPPPLPPPLKQRPLGGGGEKACVDTMGAALSLGQRRETLNLHPKPLRHWKGRGVSQAQWVIVQGPVSLVDHQYQGIWQLLDA